VEQLEVQLTRYGYDSSSTPHMQPLSTTVVLGNATNKQRPPAGPAESADKAPVRGGSGSGDRGDDAAASEEIHSPAEPATGAEASPAPAAMSENEQLCVNSSA